MTEPMVRETLHQVQDSIVVPPIDQVGFSQRTHRLRRQRRIQQTVGAGVLAIALAGAAAYVQNSTDGSNSTVVAAPATPSVPIVLDGQIQLVQDDGSLVPTGRVGTPLGLIDGEVVSIQEGVLTGPGQTQTTGVARAFAAGTEVTYQSFDGTIYRADGQVLELDGELAAVGDDTYVTKSDGELTVRTDGANHKIEAGSDGTAMDATAVEVAGDTVMVASGNTISFHHVDGSRRSGFLGGTTGALSPDGGTYAYAATANDIATGMRPGLVLYNIDSGRADRTRLEGSALDLAWVGTQVLVLTEGDASRALRQCTSTECRTLLTDVTSTLTLR